MYENNINKNIIIGRNPVLEALKSDRIIDSVLILNNINISGSLKIISSKIKEKNIVIKYGDKKTLDKLSNNTNHQGIIAFVGAKPYCSIEDILNLAKSKNQSPFVIICENIEDPHNLGAIIRTAECVGAHGIIIPKRHAVGLNFSVEKSSAGALEHMLISRVSNISIAIETLKKNGLWIYGSDMNGENLYSQDLKNIPIGLVISSEGHGISNKIKNNCDYILSIPMNGKINSLNASVAAGIIMYEIYRQKIKINATHTQKKTAPNRYELV